MTDAAATGDVKFWLKINGRSGDPLPADHPLKRIFVFDGGQTFSMRPSMKAGDKVILCFIADRNGKRDRAIYGRATIDVAHRRGIDELPAYVQKLVSDTIHEMFRKWPKIVWLRDLEVVRGYRDDAAWLWQADPQQRIVTPKQLMRKGYVNLTEHEYSVLNSALEARFEAKGKLCESRPVQVWWNRWISDRTWRVTRDKLERRIEWDPEGFSKLP